MISIVRHVVVVAMFDRALMGALIETLLLCSEVNLSVIPRYVDHLLATGVQHVFGKSLLTLTTVAITINYS